MAMPFHIAPLPPLDLGALGLLVGCYLVLGHLVEHPPRRWPSVSVLMGRYRRAWMRDFVARDNRIFDGNMLATLREGTAFLTSACMIAIGGGLAALANPQALRQVAEGVVQAPLPIGLWQFKIVVALVFVTIALLKFLWSHRLFGYCAVMMAAVPFDRADPVAMPRAMRAAELNINAARNFTAGLRGVYFAIAALGWLAGPWGLIVSTAIVTATSIRREFLSHSREAILHGAQDEPHHP